MTFENALLPGVPAHLVRAALAAAAGNEIDSGKLHSPESSAALAVNAFGWFLERPQELPPFPPLAHLDWLATHVAIERQMRFPWSGGRHPWLDAAVEMPTQLIGVESKRFEPFRDVKTVSLAAVYDRDVWGDRMEPFTAARDALREGRLRFQHLDAAQLVKHACGLVTEGRRLNKQPTLLYLYAQPSHRGTHAITEETHAAHRAEIATFAGHVVGAEVGFAACSYEEWLSGWNGQAAPHAEALRSKFALY